MMMETGSLPPSLQECWDVLRLRRSDGHLLRLMVVMPQARTVSQQGPRGSSRG